MKPSATIATLVAAQPAPEQLHRRARGDLPLAGCLPVDDDRLVVLLMDEPGGIARAHGRAPALRGDAMVKMLSLLRRPAVPGRHATNVPLGPPGGCLPRGLRRRGSVATPAYVIYGKPVYDSCLGPDSSVG